MIRLTAIELQNFKNVKKGKINLSAWNGNPNTLSADIVGIYGQNGSGKTSIIRALNILRNIFRGRAVDELVKDCVAKGKETARIQVEGVIFEKESAITWFFSYVVKITEKKDWPSIIAEKLQYKRLDTDEKTSLRKLFDYRVEKNEELNYSIAPLTAWNSIYAIDEAIRTDLLVAQRLAVINSTSFLFSAAFREASSKLWEYYLSESSKRKNIQKALGEVLAPLYIILLQLVLFALQDFSVINAKHQAESMTSTLHILTHEGELGALSDSSFDVNLEGSSVLDEEKMQELSRTLESINPVLNAIIPGFHLSLVELEKMLLENGSVGFRIELTCTRGDVTVPLRCESEGVKKLISIITLLIDVYAKPGACVAIDELDSGVFEYLLGEILQVLQDHGRGQLIFTAHNLRPLEIVNKSNLVFTTTNPTKRYIGFKGNRDSNNLRNQYLRAINLGGQAETIYEPTSKFEIEAALYDAAFPMQQEQNE